MESRALRESDTVNRLSTPQFLDKMFIKYDANSDGRLSKFEFSEILRFLTKLTGTTFPHKQDIEDIFSYLDTDGDQTISKE